MEITNEIKAKVFAQYLGQIWRWQVGSLVYTIKFCLDDLDKFIVKRLKYSGQTVEHKLILRPLSKITDEDAIECAILEGLVNAKVSQRGDGGINMKDDSYDLLLSFDCEIWLYKYGLKTHTNKSFLIYQYLISKGYDLPNYLLGGKTLKECGLAIYE